eukprot:gnl/Trimastix_PCT/2630.p1 GENE.gnl/Trimastix_PCT/2630~~gnl/Trimastix_PCT/2630.p1  ORF type:complete len:200 (+),score=24.77 gnl/Trimastix_PCT/2630:67-666(+)
METTKLALVALFPNFEEIEALSAVDVLRRGNVNVTMVSVTEDIFCTGSHGIKVQADCLLSSFDTTQHIDAVICPGGPGWVTLPNCEGLRSLIQSQAQAGRITAAICAAPVVLGRWGVLEGRKATCYPALRDELVPHCRAFLDAPVVRDGHILTSRGPGTSMAFALEVLASLQGTDVARKVHEEMVHNLVSPPPQGPPSE